MMSHHPGALPNSPFYGGASPRAIQTSFDHVTPSQDQYIKSVLNLSTPPASNEPAIISNVRNAHDGNINASKGISTGSIVEHHGHDLLNNPPPALSSFPAVDLSKISHNRPHTPSGFLPDHYDNNAPSPVSPNTKNLLTTFNMLNYNANQYSFLGKSNNNLLSNSETNDIESFLDSIANDESFGNLSKYWSAIDPAAANATTTQKNTKTNSNIPQQLEAKRTAKTAKTDGNAATKSDTPDIVFKKENSATVKSTSMKKSKDNDSSSTGSRKGSKSNTNGTGSKRKTIDSKQVSSRKALTEDEKKSNHTSSEQRRRDQIKDAFDRLVAIMGDALVNIEEENNDDNNGSKRKRRKKSTKKSPSKYTVMLQASNEIERLLEVNKKLSQLVNTN
ncbi:unnamed protein product [Ambrosiozyma monospora]|uniref:Unnamed protein product n=1 Tax=Ambrosiozyma monospora TaxID=43982 RepID=A0A9W7DL20_AMBMO|nr:unnamed protein product [Ambrosiozyma monospora]